MLDQDNRYGNLIKDKFWLYAGVQKDVLKLRRIELIGFKSFSDKGEIVVNESGVTAIVGPNGCGKSNVSDAIAWVLGEQSAKSLRGEKMEDVIFNGTRNRAPMGMAEVTITLSDLNPGSNNGNGRNGGPPAGPRDVVVQRRLYRSGESVYLVDGRPCRLRDIQDIFLGTGLGLNSYAIIEQGRVGQLLSAKPSDRRSIIEEAAGVTKFRAKRKLAESRLEAARENLARVNDILAEVERQRNSLKRQAGKARRYTELRNRMRELLGRIFSTRAEVLIAQQQRVEADLNSIGDEGRRLELELEHLNEWVHQRRSDVESQEHRLEEMRGRRSEVELEHEKAIQRIERLRDQIHGLDDRKAALKEERQRTLQQLDHNSAEQRGKSDQLADTERAKLAMEQSLANVNARITELAQRRQTEVQTIEQLRRKQFELVGLEARLHNEIGSRKEIVARISAQVQRLEREETESRAASEELEEQLKAASHEHSGQRAGFTQLRERIAEVEQAHTQYKSQHAEAVKSAAEAKSREEAIRQRLQTIGELALHRAYSSESVQQFFNYVRSQDRPPDRPPLGILADFVEVEPEYESIVEDLLKFELQYVVVHDRQHAEQSLAIVKEVTKGRLNCLLTDAADAAASPEPVEGAIPLTSVVRLDERVRHFNEYIRDAYIVETLDQAWLLSERYPHFKFVVRTGEVVSGHVVGWGEHDVHGPLSLKREIRELDRRMESAKHETAVCASDVVRLEGIVRQTEALKSQLSTELQELEKMILTLDHRVRSLTADFERSQQRCLVARSEIEHVHRERLEIESSLVQAELELTGTATQKAAIDEQLKNRVQTAEELRIESENIRRDAAELQSKLAVLDERRSAAIRELQALRHGAAELNERVRRADRQIQQAEEQQDQTDAMIRNLEESKYELQHEREQLDIAIDAAAAQLDELRHELHDAENKWDETRALVVSWKDRHNALEIEKTQVDSDLKHLASTCISELNDSIESVCLTYFEALTPAEMEVREREYVDMREKLESMGAVNMMAVEEHQEAEARFQFLTTQRQDLLDSIRDTTQAIDEIDSVCRRQFKEAFEAINIGFREAFIALFGGGHGELRLLEEAAESDAGVEIVAQPPGKKLQNVLLLSGGEKALTALALLIALFRYKPSPFCILDEVDAPLDDANVDRFAQIVRDMSQTTQFIVITHSKRTMETASTLYGVTMEEPGISKIVSVRLN